MWDTEYTDEFKSWWLKITETQQNDIAAMVKLLMEMGPKLPFPGLIHRVLNSLDIPT